MREQQLGTRVVVASLVALCAIAAFAVVGGTGLAGALKNPGKGQYGGQYQGKVTICHKHHVTIRVATVAWLRAHQHHGDTMGPCSAAAIAAAKVKASKLKAKHTQAATGVATTTAPGSNGKSHGQKGPKAAVGASAATKGPGSGNGNGNANGHGKNG
jgi:hypothetical protein